MFSFLPLFFLLICSVILRPYLEGWRAALLGAAVLTATALTAVTEGLSLIRSLSFYPLAVSWLFLIITGLKRLSFRRHSMAFPKVNFSNWFLSEKILLGFIAFIGIVSAITAVVGMPNTWDAMTYHLSRVEHWVQNKTIAYYPTNTIRQLSYAPWAEFAMAHLRILGGGPASANFVQWLAMAGCLTAVSLVAGQLGANRVGQMTAATLAACLPMGILQSVSTQNDYVCGFWLIVFVYFIIQAVQVSTKFNYALAGLSLGLAFLTKGYSYIFAFPFLIWILCSTFRRRISKGLAGLLIIIICALGLNTGQYIRNAQVFGTPTGTTESLTNKSFDLKILWVNVLRNMGLHLATPWMDVNEKIKQTVTGAAQLFGADINDARATYGWPFEISDLSLDEDYCGNFLHTILFAVIFVLSWFYRGPKGNIRFYTCAVLFSFLLFCCIVRFQPWNSRFHLPLFILFCPVAGALLGYFLRQKSVILMALFFLGAMPWLFLNDQHPWRGVYSIWKQPRPVQYFYKRPGLAMPYATVAGYIKSMGCQQIGLLMGEDSWEYPWWVLLSKPGVRIEHVGVSNASAPLRYPLGNFQACAIIVSGVEASPYIMTGNAIYAPAGSIPAGDDKITVFLRKL